MPGTLSYFVPTGAGVDFVIPIEDSVLNEHVHIAEAPADSCLTCLTSVTAVSSTPILTTLTDFSTIATVTVQSLPLALPTTPPRQHNRVLQTRLTSPASIAVVHIRPRHLTYVADLSDQQNCFTRNAKLAVYDPPDGNAECG